MCNSGTNTETVTCMSRFQEQYIDFGTIPQIVTYKEQNVCYSINLLQLL